MPRRCAAPGLATPAAAAIWGNRDNQPNTKIPLSPQPPRRARDDRRAALDRLLERYGRIPLDERYLPQRLTVLGAIADLNAPRSRWLR